MNILSLLSSVEAPKGLWTTLINWFQSGIGNFGWTILLLVIVVKLVISPLDFAVKYTTKQQTLVQQKCAPQVEKIKKKFGKDQNQVRIQTQSLYKREGLKTGVGCIVMLLNLVLTMVIFFTFYDSLRKNSAYEAIKQYEELNVTYTTTFYSSLTDYKSDDDITSENAEQVTKDYYTAKETLESLESETDEGWTENNDIVTKYESAINDSIKKAETATLEMWESNKANWLWVENIWVADSTTSPFPTYEKLQGAASSGYRDYFEKNIDAEQYSTIAKLINEQGGRTYNGYYILAVLAAIITFLSQYISELHTKLKNKKANIVAKNATDSSTGFAMKIMKIIMPIIMLTFVLTSTASFGIYILASNIASIVLGEVATLIINKMTAKKQRAVEEFLEKEANRQIRKGKLQEK